MSLNGWQIGLICYFACNALLTIGYIGRERKPITPGAAVIVVILSAAMVWVAIKS